MSKECGRLELRVRKQRNQQSDKVMKTLSRHNCRAATSRLFSPVPMLMLGFFFAVMDSRIVFVFGRDRFLCM